MSIDNIADLVPRVQYTATAGQDEFPYPFPIFQDADLVVTVDDAEQTLGDDYTVSGATDDTGGYVTFTTPLTGGEIVTIWRDTEIKRTSDFPQNGPWFSEATNDEFDRLTVIAQELKQNLRRAIRFPMSATQTDAGAELTPIDSWLSKFLYINSSGQLEPAVGVEAGAITQQIVGALLNPRTQTEIDLGVFPVDYSVGEGDIRRYGAVDGEDCTTAVQTAMNVAFANKGTMFVPEGTWYCTPGLTLTFSSDRANTGFRVQGEGLGSVLRAPAEEGGTTPLIELTCPTPTGAPFDAHVVFRDLAIIRTGSVIGAGLKLTNIANFVLDHVAIRGFNKNLHLVSALIGQCYSSHFTDGLFGVLAEQNGYPGTTGVTAGSTTNLVTFDGGCRFNYNTEWGVYWDHGAGVEIDGDIELNGTVGDADTGGVYISSNMAPDALVACVKILGWFEGNKGTQIKVAAPANSALLNVEIAPRQLVSSESGRAIVIGGANFAHLHGIQCGPGEVIDITATHSLVQNVTATTLTDNSTYRTHINVATSAGERPWGVPGSFQGTITGTTGQPANRDISYVMQGDWVELFFDSTFSATSNTTACTITGMPASIRPSVTRANVGVCTNNGTAVPAQYAIAADGTITLSPLNAGVLSSTGFTAAGTKGTATCSIRYKR